MKDYYKIMNVPYDASAEEIRKAYHHFAKKYHPDKNGGQVAATLFLDIQEAYNTLSDEERRRSFHAKTSYPLPGAKRAVPVTTTETILQQCQNMHQQLQNSNRHQLNPAFISGTVGTILSEKNMVVLLAEKDTVLLEKIVAQLLPILKILPYRLIVPYTGQLLRVAANHTALQAQIIAFSDRKRKLRYWEKYNLVIILVATLLLCILIIFLSE